MYMSCDVMSFGRRVHCAGCCVTCIFTRGACHAGADLENGKGGFFCMRDMRTLRAGENFAQSCPFLLKGHSGSIDCMELLTVELANKVC